MEEKKLSFALAGNPNCGKTTLFNSLTGSTAYVGNWPGVTVEKRSGTYQNKELGKAEIVDLPGIYSLSPYTPEEVISRNYILESHPDCVINVIDATNLERNLYRTTQILEMDVPVVIALNRRDALNDTGVTIDAKELSKRLGVPVVEISALHRTNLDKLRETAREAAKTKRTGCSAWTMGNLTATLEQAKKVYESENVENPLFHAVKALEGDELELQKNKPAYEAVAKLNVSADDFEANSADLRYKYIAKQLEGCRTGAPIQESKKLSLSDKIDKVLTNKWAAFPIRIVMLFLVFHLTFSEDLFYLQARGVNFGDGYQGLIKITVGTDDPIGVFDGLFWSEDGIHSIGTFFQNLIGAGNDSGIQGLICLAIEKGLVAAGSPEWLTSFIYDGILNGIAAVIGFVPLIMVLFAFFALREDSGYRARIAFVLDRAFRRFGVSGRAFIPMIMGLGCGVPAIINTRTLASDKERTKTRRVIPFFTCGAKSTFLSVIAAAVAEAAGFDGGLFTFLIYRLGFVIAIVAVIARNETTQREKVPPFIRELPSYHRPQAHALLIHVWDKGKHYIKKAFTIIFASTILIWFLQSFTPTWTFIPGTDGLLDDSASILCHIGQIRAPIFTPMGFGNVQGGDLAWTFAVSSIQGIVAKEAVTSTMEQLSARKQVESILAAHSIEATGGFSDIVKAAQRTTSGSHSIDAASLTAFAVFNRTTIPCFASVATRKGESVSHKSYLGTLAFWVVTSYVMGCLTYISIEWAWTLAITLPVIVLALVGLHFYNKNYWKKQAAKEAAAA